MTTANAARLESRSSIPAATIQVSDIVIGNDLLELLSSAMYVDPMSVFREYVQNAADSIDAARREGRISPNDVGRVAVQVDSRTRSIRIRDNGAGLPQADFAKRLVALGGSAKRGSDARGFRGVGRLAGLAYAQELFFRSRSQANEPVSELRWDGRALKAVSRNTDGVSDIRSIIERVVTVQTIEGDYPDHFFEVELRGVLRLRGDILLNPHAIADYLAQVAPVPFAPSFRLGAKIVEHLSQHMVLQPLEILIEGIDGVICRPQRDEIPNGNKPPLTAHEVTFIEIPDVDGGLAAVGWFLHHDYEGALASATLQKGFRLRSGDIQVGGDALLDQEFPEPRFNSWTVGELHVLDRRIVPNGRRDHFEQNVHYNNLVNHLGPHFRDIANRCRSSSIKRKAQRDVDVALRAEAAELALLSQNGAGISVQNQLIGDTNPHRSDVGQTAVTDNNDAPSGQLQALSESARENISIKKTQRSAQSLEQFTLRERQNYQRVFELIYECSEDKDNAKLLIYRIIARLN